MPRARTLAIVLLLLSSVAAGCLGSQTEDGGTEDGDRAPGGAEAGPVELYLTEDLGLTQVPPLDEDPKGVPVGDFYGTWTTGGEQPTWTGTGLDEAILIENATLTFYYTSDTAVATTGPQDQGFPEFVVYLGTEAAPMGWASLQGPDVVQQGEIVEIQGNLELPTGGLVLPAGAEPVVKIAPVQAQQEEGSSMEILVNSTETPSRATLVTRPVELAPSQEELVLDETGVLAGSAYALGQTEGATSQTFEIEIPEEVLGLTAALERTTGAGVADIDLEARGPSGDVVAMSVTPEDDEGLALYTPNLEAVGAGTWELRVTNYGNAAVEFDLQASLLQPAGTGP